MEKFMGFVLHHTSLSESRLILDLFTESAGTRQGVLRLGKKESRALLTPLTCVSFQLSGREHQALKRLSELRVESHCFDLAADYLGLALVCHWAFLVQRTQPDDHPEPRVFRLLDHTLGCLRRQTCSPQLLHLANLYFEVWLLHFCGVFARQLPNFEVTDEALSPEERLYCKLDRQLLSLVFQRKIEDYLADALKLGSLHGSTAALGALWERLLDRELKTRQVFYKQLQVRGNV